MSFLFDSQTKLDDKFLRDLISYAFDGNSYSVQSAVVSLLFKINDSKSFDALKDVLINPNCLDKIKAGIIGYLASVGISGEFPAVFYDIYRVINIHKTCLYDQDNTVFNEAYAYVLGKISPVEDDLLPVKETAEKMFFFAKDLGFINEITDSKSLAAVIFEFSGLKNILSRRTLNKFFDANIRNTKKIRDLYINAGYTK